MIIAISEGHVAGSLPSGFCSRGYMVWKMMLVEEFKNGCLVLAIIDMQMG